MTVEEMEKEVYPAKLTNGVEAYPVLKRLKQALPTGAYEILAKNHNEKIKERKE